MSTKYLGPTIDIHTGGVDNIFPHHQNEIAQSEAATGQKFVRYWMHCEHLLIDNKKMSKSLGNILTLRDLLAKGYKSDALRYLFLSSHYRSKLNFTRESIQYAANTLDRLNQFVERMRDYESKAENNEEITLVISRTGERFDREMDNDLNTPGALAAIFELVGRVNRALEEGSLSSGNAQAVYGLILKSNRVLGVLSLREEEPSREVEVLIEERERARRIKDFQRADEIRRRLGEMGIFLEDTKEGVRWRKKAG
jgi:cysteinyl-tRNA synthetase